jgi:hypothetical protein
VHVDAMIPGLKNDIDMYVLTIVEMGTLNKVKSATSTVLLSKIIHIRYGMSTRTYIYIYDIYI